MNFLNNLGNSTLFMKVLNITDRDIDKSKTSQVSIDFKNIIIFTKSIKI